MSITTRKSLCSSLTPTSGEETSSFIIQYSDFARGKGCAVYNIIIIHIVILFIYLYYFLYYIIILNITVA